jgi:hypothetical protein
VEAKATDESGISKLSILIDGKIVKTCSAVATCTYSWNPGRISAGPHIIEATAIDSSVSSLTGTVLITVTK